MANKLENKTIERDLPVKPIHKKSIPEEVISQIKSLIDAGHLKPGSKLPAERELARMMNVSRPSLREALGVLSLLGVIENRPGSGTYLTSSSERWPTEPFSILFLLKKSTLFQIFEARKILEGAIAALAATQRTDEDLQTMEEALKGMEVNVEHPEEYEKHELDFHRGIIEAAGNRVIADLMEKLYRLLRETRSRIYHQYASRIKPYREQDYENHEVIFNAIKAGDAYGATKAITDHLLDFEKTLKDEKDRQNH